MPPGGKPGYPPHLLRPIGGNQVSLPVCDRQTGSARSCCWSSLRMREHSNERPRYAGRIQRLDEQARIADLPAVGAAHETSQLRFDSPPSPRGLLLEGAERSEV